MNICFSFLNELVWFLTKLCPLKISMKWLLIDKLTHLWLYNFYKLTPTFSLLGKLHHYSSLRRCFIQSYIIFGFIQIYRCVTRDKVHRDSKQHAPCNTDSQFSHSFPSNLRKISFHSQSYSHWCVWARKSTIAFRIVFPFLSILKL